MKSLLKVFSNTPYWVLELVLLLNVFPSLLFGVKYSFIKKRISSCASSNELNFSLVNHAIEKVPYYRNAYGDFRISSVEDFKKNIEFLDKDLVVNNFDDFFSECVDSDDYNFVTTGGTTGSPMQILVPKNRYKIEYAAVHAIWSKYGYKFSKRAVLRNDRVIGKDYYINPITKEYIFDGFDLSDEGFMKLYKVMKKKNISFLHAYTSNAYEFAKFLVRNNLETGFIFAFLTASENVLPHQHDFITRVAGIKHCNFYGHSEKLVIAGFCEYSDVYHFEPAYGFVELLDDNGSDVVVEGGVGQIVATTVSNYGMPLIRYKTGDYAEYAFNKCPHCGHNGLSVKRILGRWNGDRIYNKDRSFVTTTALNLHSEVYKHILGLQYFQERLGELDVRVIPASSFSEKILIEIKEAVAKNLSVDCKVNVIKVDELERNENGKFLFLVSHVGK